MGKQSNNEPKQQPTKPAPPKKHPWYKPNIIKGR